MDIVKLKPEREKSLKRCHSWVFSGAVAKVLGNPYPGATVEIQDSNGTFLAYGAYSPASQIRVRAWSWDPKIEINQDFFRSRLQDAIAYRASLPYVRNSLSSLDIGAKTTDRSTIQEAQTGSFPEPDNRSLIPDHLSLRLVHAESDGIPGLVIDRYQDVLVMQFLSAGAEYWREAITDLIQELTGINQVYERSDVDVRSLEGLEERVGLLKGNYEPLIEIIEHGLRFRVDLAKGHKTGFYLDQRQNRFKLRDFVNGKDVLDCFCYSGGFLINALYAGARTVTAVDSAEAAIALARENVNLNNLTEKRVTWHCEDVFQQLRCFRDQDRSFDTIILDPPKFAPTAAHAPKASRGYKDINLLALKLLKPGGTLMTFSCSGGISPDLFKKIVAGAALDAEVKPRLIAHLEQSPDHPVALNFPEGAYLKGLLLQI